MPATKYLNQKKAVIRWGRLVGQRAERLKKLFTSTPMNWEYVTYGRKAA